MFYINTTCLGQLIVVIILAVAQGCRPVGGKNGGALHQESLKFETVSIFHKKLNNLCVGYNLEAPFTGSLGFSGRALAMVDPDVSLLEWEVVAPQEIAGRGDLQKVFFRVRIAPGSNDAGITHVTINSSAIEVFAEVRDGSLNDSRNFLDGKSIREFLQRLGTE